MAHLLYLETCFLVEPTLVSDVVVNIAEAAVLTPPCASLGRCGGGAEFLTGADGCALFCVGGTFGFACGPVRPDGAGWVTPAIVLLRRRDRPPLPGTAEASEGARPDPSDAVSIYDVQDSASIS